MSHPFSGLEEGFTQGFAHGSAGYAGRWVTKRAIKRYKQDVSDVQNSLTHPKMGKRVGRRAKRTFKKSYKKSFRRRGTFSLKRKVAKLWRNDVVERPAKHILYSDITGISGSNLLLQNTGPATIINRSNSYLQYLNVCSRGTTVQNRLADYTYTTKIQLKLQVNFGTGVTGTAFLNWMLVLDKELGGVAKTAGNFCTDYFGVSSPYDIVVPNINNRDVRGKYRVLAKGRVYMKETVSGVVEKEHGMISWHGKGIRTSHVLGNAGTAADIDTGGIFLFVWTGDATATNGITAYCEGNVFFHDQV